MGEKDTGNISARFVVENDEFFPLLGPSKKFATVMLIEVRVPKGTCAAGMPSQNEGFGILGPFHAIENTPSQTHGKGASRYFKRGQSGWKGASTRPAHRNRSEL